MKLRNLSALAGTILIVAVACTPGGGTATNPGASQSGGGGASGSPSGSGRASGTVKIGVDLPLSGAEVANGVPTRQGVELAVKEANDAGGVGGYTVELNVQDDAVNGVHNPDQGATNANNLIADEAVVAMVGPFNSNVARAIIPVTNAAGLAQCSPSNTAVDLTKEGSEDLRPENLEQRNYFRVATPDDVQGPANGEYAYEDLGARNAFVVDDTEAFGVGVANTFTERFEELGGTEVGRQGNDFTTNQTFTSILNAAPEFDVIFFGGTQVTGGGQLRKDMGSAGMLGIPFVGPDGTTDLQPGGAEGAMITLAGLENSDNIHGTVAGIHDIPDPEAFADAYSAEFGDPPGAYSALAYACTQVILQAIEDSAADAADMAALRDAVREDVFAGESFETVLGEISFDENGDSSQKFISFYKTDPAAEDGAGGWVFVRQQDFSEAP